eukprot:XP_001710207.1 Hypothetical protein GL50803_38370 [Giardia lamblia ATCC 50803]
MHAVQSNLVSPEDKVHPGMLAPSPKKVVRISVP